MKLYQRYFLREFAKVFFLVLGSFYFLFVLIDFASNMRALQQEGLQFQEVIVYYLLQFALQAEILLPTAFTIALIKVTTQFNLGNELVALLSSGLSYKTLFRPFIYSATFCALLLYLNFQFLNPIAASKLETFRNVYLKGVEENVTPIGRLTLDDGSLLLYSSYEPKRGAFLDAYWILNSDELYRIKTLFPFAKTPRGLSVDHLKRDATSQMQKKESYDARSFPQMKFETKSLLEAVHPPESEPLSALLSTPFSFSKEKSNDREARCKTVLYHRLTIPLLSLLAAMGLAPFCLAYRRHIPIFMIYAFSLFALITMFMLTNATSILGQAQVLPPLWVIFSPYVLCFTFFGYKYATL